LTAEKKFWRCVQDGETPRLFGVEPPRARLEAVRVVDMSCSNSWAEFAATYRRTRPAYQEHEGAKADLKKLVPEDAREAAEHGLREGNRRSIKKVENNPPQSTHLREFGYPYLAARRFAPIPTTRPVACGASNDGLGREEGVDNCLYKSLL
jgi:hypothetical protein